MRFVSLLALSLAVLHFSAWPQSEAAQPSLTLPEALARAESANPVLRNKAAQLAAAQGAATDAAALLYNNPQVTGELTRRQFPPAIADRPQREWSAGVAQTFEIGGQPGFRREATSAALEALRLEIEDLRAQQRAEVARRFYRVLALQRRVEVETQAARLFDETARAVERRRAAGEDTRLDANVALVEAERARNQLAVAQEQLIEAGAALAVPLQLPPQQLPAVSGEILPGPTGYSEQVLRDRVLEQPRLRALAARERSTRARLRLERAARLPDVTLGLSHGREGAPGDRERFNTLTMSVPLPLFRRNAAGIGAAATEATQAEIERRAAERDIPAQVHALWLRLQSLRERIDRLQRSVLPTLTRNEELSQKSRQAGQIGLLEQLVTNRQVIDARRDLNDALLEYHNTRLELEALSGWTGQP